MSAPATSMAPPGEAKSRAPSSTANPYVGPRSLQRGERIYGRSRELFELQNLLIAERIVLLYSPSGAGKTSLIQAGLLPEMEREEFDALPLIAVGKAPTRAVRNRYLASALRSLEENLPSGVAPLHESDLAALSFAGYLDLRKETRRWESTLLIFDQFEEVLTADPLDEEAKIEFFSEIGAALRDSSRWALFSIRERYLAALDPYTRALPTRLKATMRLDLLDGEGAREAIEQPAAAQGVHFTPEAVSQIVEELREVAVQSLSGKSERRLARYIEPVHLQVLCFGLWEKPRTKPGEIGTGDIATTGNVEAALGEYYASRIATVAGESGVLEKTLRQWFDRDLITEAGIRLEVLKGEGSTDGISDAAIAGLEAAHLIQSDERPGATSLELSHDRLVRPIRADNAKWFERHLSLLQQQATLWERQGRNEVLCFRGETLREAKQWAESHPAEMTRIDREFLEASVKDERVRSVHRIWRWAIVATTVVVVTTTLAIIAVIQRKTAVAQRQIAQEQEQIAKKQETIASARGLASLAYRLLDERLDLATLLAYEAWRRIDLPETSGTLLAATLFNPRLVTFLHGQHSPIGAVAFASDGKLLATGDFSSRIVLWNVETHRPERALPPFLRGAVRGIAFSADGKYMAASDSKGGVFLRIIATEELVRLSADAGEPVDVWSVTFSADSHLLASADSKGRVTIWDLATKISTTLEDLAGKQLRAVAFSASSSFIATGDQDGNVFVWQRQAEGWMPFDQFSAAAASEQESKQRGGPRITCLAFSPRDENLLVSGSRDWTVNLRHVSAKQNVAQGRHWGSLNSVAFSPDGVIIVSGAQDATLRLWKVPKASNATDPALPPAQTAPARPLEMIGRPITGHVGWVLAVAFSPDGHRIASGGIDRNAILWDAQHAVPEGPNASDTTRGDFVVGLSPDGSLAVQGHSDGRLVARDCVSGREVALPNHDKPVISIGFSRDGRFLVSASSDATSGTILVSEVDALAAEAIRIPVGSRITSASISPDGKVAAAAANGGEILLFDVEAQKQRGDPLRGLKNVFVYTVSFSPDGQRVTAAGTNQHATTWNLATGKGTEQFIQHNGTVRVAEFSPDGSVLATASGDNTVLLSDPVTGKSIGPALTGHRGPVVSLAFQKDGKRLASGSEDRGIILWDLETRQQVGPRLIKHSDAVRQLRFGEDGKSLISVSSLADPIKWELDPAKLAERSRARANRNLTAAEWKAHIDRDEPYRKTWEELPAASENVAAPAPSASPINR